MLELVHDVAISQRDAFLRSIRDRNGLLESSFSAVKLSLDRYTAKASLAFSSAVTWANC